MANYGGGSNYYRFGATAAKPVARPVPATVTGQAAGLVTLAAKPVKWAFHTAGGLVQWAGGLLNTIGNKL